jgi:hypothetical protein
MGNILFIVFISLVGIVCLFAFPATLLYTGWVKKHRPEKYERWEIDSAKENIKWQREQEAKAAERARIEAIALAEIEAGK